MENPSVYGLAQDECGLKRVGLVAGATGSAGGDCVALFANAATAIGNLPLASWVTIVDSATLGTSFKITRRGFYAVTAGVAQLASSTAFAGLTLDADAALMTADPIVTNALVLDGVDSLTLAATLSTIKLSAMVQISQRAAADPLGGFLRLQISNSANAAPNPALLDLTQCFIRIMRVSDDNSFS